MSISKWAEQGGYGGRLFRQAQKSEERRFPPWTLKFLEPRSPAALHSLLCISETRCLPWICSRHTGVLAPDLEKIRCRLSAAWCCNPSWEGQIGVTCDFQVSFWSSGPSFADWPHVHSNTATVPHLPHRAAHLLPSTPFEVQRLPFPGAPSLTSFPNLSCPT